MKKICKLICCLTLCLSLAACSSANKVEDDAVKAFLDAVVKLQELESTSYEANLKANASGQDMEITAYGDIINKKDDTQLSLIVDVTAQGQKMEKLFEMYIINDATYLSFLGQKQKQALNQEHKDELDAIENFDTSAGVDVFKPYLKSATKKGNSVDLVFDMEKLAELENTKEAIENYTYNDFTIHLELEDGFISKVDLDIDLVEKDTSMEMKATGTITLSNINSLTEISFPDFSDYKESASAL